MKCRVCNYVGPADRIQAGGSDEWRSFIGYHLGNHIGSVDIIVCPKCGILYTDMRKQIDLGETE